MILDCLRYRRRCDPVSGGRGTRAAQAACLTMAVELANGARRPALLTQPEEASLDAKLTFHYAQQSCLMKFSQKVDKSIS
jgi:hypothetical protein